jgi:O-antigen ligase
LKKPRQQGESFGIISSNKSFVLTFSLVLTTLAVTPDLTFDPINLPKFTIMAFLAGFLLPKLSSFKALFLDKRNRPWLLTLVLFVVGLVISLIGSKAPLAIQLYGAPGRLTGFITYLSLSIYLTFCIITENRILTAKLSKILIMLGAVMSVYGLFQSLGLELFGYGSSYGSPVFGTFGNSNFLSGFLGITASATVIMIFRSESAVFQRALFACYSLLSLITIYLSNSQQGFLNFAAGLGIGLSIYLFSRRKTFFASITLCLCGLSGLAIVAGVFNLGPFAGFIYQASVSARQGYWNAAVSMLTNNPFFGVGMDNFLNWYRRFRSAEITVKNPNAVSDSAHSVFLDIGAGSGLLTLVAYIALMMLVCRAIIKVVRRNKFLEIEFIALSAAWFAYQVQSLISINQIALATWGWVLSGIIIGYEIRTADELAVTSKGNRTVSTELKNSRGLSKVTLVYAVIAFLIATIPFVTSVRFLSILKTGNPVTIQNSAYFFPHDYYRFIYVVTVLRDNNFDNEALNVIQDAAREFPDTFEIWALYANLSSASPAEVMRAQAEMKRLDPYNPDLK